VRLDKKSRAKAVEIVKTLKAIKSRMKRSEGKPAADVEQLAFERLASFPEFKVEYVAIRDARSLKPIKKISATTQAVALIAAQIGGVRLIDNMLL
jgi:pantoate--beta-alanine ligase